MIEIENLTKRFGAVTAVAGFRLYRRPGRGAGLSGPQWRGQDHHHEDGDRFSTPDSGTARICGHDIVSDTIAAQRGWAICRKAPPPMAK